MRVVFISNYFNHHQAPFSYAIDKLTNGNYTFIETEPIEEERKNMGWGINNYPKFVKKSYLSKQEEDECFKLIEDADVVVQGCAPRRFISGRLKDGKLVLFYFERIYKDINQRWYKWIKRYIWYYFLYRRYKNAYLLCASAYTAADFAKTKCFMGKAYKWGYFPAVKKYENIEKLIADKTPVSILWVARLIEWKHPELPIKIAKSLKESGYKFQLSLIGNGELESKIRELIKSEGVEDCVTMLGAMKPEEVRKHMEQSEIFLFTSDFNEGWGAVLNESMNSACAVVASHAIGAVPFLINDGENGFIYKNGDEDDLFNKVKFLLDNPEKRKEMSLNAYKTMTEIWNAENAVKNFMCTIINFEHETNQLEISNEPMSLM